MKRLLNLLASKTKPIRDRIDRFIEETLYPNPPRGSIWTASFQVTKLEGADPFVLVSVSRVQKERVEISQLHVTSEGFLTNIKMWYSKDYFFDIFRRLDESSESERSIWPKLLRRD